MTLLNADNVLSLLLGSLAYLPGTRSFMDVSECEGVIGVCLLAHKCKYHRKCQQGV
jgi:hypothetical protein